MEVYIRQVKVAHAHDQEDESSPPQVVRTHLWQVWRLILEVILPAYSCVDLDSSDKAVVEKGVPY